MRSKIAQKILDETPESVKDEVKEYAKNRIRMNDKERKIHVLEMVLELCWPRLLPEELADLRSLMEDLKGEGWISVKDRLPDFGVPVLIYNANLDLFEASERNDMPSQTYEQIEGDTYKRITHPFWCWSNNEATHWKPLPQPPKA